MKFQDKYFEVPQTFTPSSPVDQRALFAGRIPQIVRLVDCCNEKGRHAVLYGDRGVGKTSLANVVHEELNITGWARTPCESEDTFTTLMRRMLKELSFTVKSAAVGFRKKEGAEEVVTLADSVDQIETLQVSDVTAILRNTAFNHWFFVLDEFDRLTDSRCRRSVTDLIKALSDYGCGVTIVVVGVADDLSQLVQDHPSIERNITQIRLPIMSREELEEILQQRWQRLGMTAEQEGVRLISGLSCGFPHYTHLLGKHASQHALKDDRLEVRPTDVISCLRGALQESQETLARAYDSATESSISRVAFEQTLLACAMVAADDAGYFRAAQIAPILSRLKKAPVIPQQYTYHLSKFSSADGSNVLVRTQAKRSRYRFKNPMLRPYVLLRGVQQGQLQKHELLDILG